MNSIFSDVTELQRLSVQRKLLWEYEYPIYQQIIGARKGLTLLDVGCNDGRKTIERFDKKNFSKIVGIDCLEQLIAYAEENFADGVYSFRCCDVTEAGFADRLREIMRDENIGSFDIINCSFLLMHLENPCFVLKELRQLLAPEGCLVVIEPDDTQSRMIPDKGRLFEEFLDVISTDPYAGRRHFGGEVAGLLEKSGYQRIQLRLSEIAAHRGEREKKESMFTTFCSYLPDDFMLLRKEMPENPVYQEGSEWIEKSFARLHEQMIKEETEIFMGVKIYTCGGR